MFKGSSKQLCASGFQSIITAKFERFLVNHADLQKVGNDATSCVSPLGKILVLQVVPAAPNSAGFSLVHYQFISCWAVGSSCKGKVVNETFVMMIHVPSARPLTLTTF